MKSLIDLYKSHSGKVSDKWSLYLREYDRLFSPYREQAISMLEIGVQNGGSLEIWSKYFPNAQKIVGCDINPDCAELSYEDPRIAVIVGDATGPETQSKLLQHSANFDLIIDDGSHSSSDIFKAFARYFPTLNAGGLFVAEDLHCSYWQAYEGGIFHPYSSINFFKLLADIVNYEHWGVEKSRDDLIAGFKKFLNTSFDESLLSQISSVEFINSICVIRKSDLHVSCLGDRVIAGSQELVVAGHLNLGGQKIEVPNQALNAWSTLSRPPAETYQELICEIQISKAMLTERESQIARLTQTLAVRESQISSLNLTLAERESQIASLAQMLAERESQISSLTLTLAQRDSQLVSIYNSFSWRVTRPLRYIATTFQVERTNGLVKNFDRSEKNSNNSFRVAKPLRSYFRPLHLVGHVLRLARQYMNHRGGLFSGGLKMVGRSLEILRHSGFRGFVQRLREYSVVSSQRQYAVPTTVAFVPQRIDLNKPDRFDALSPQVSFVHDKEAVGLGYRFWKQYELATNVDVIVCVHNALDDVRRCLSSLVRYSVPQCNIIVVDDGSQNETREYLREFCDEQGATLLRNEIAEGYTFAANKGMRASSAGFVILLNSDTIVTLGWLEKMVACAMSDPQIGIVGPLSNTASWQSVPKIEEDGDWATNPLPVGLSILEMGGLIAKYSGQVYPRMSFLNGFCLLIRREVMDQLGLFDEETFGKGYGEENDYCLRARKAGWMLALADDAYVYHAQSKSYSHEKRKLLADHAGMQLASKHGGEIIAQGVDQCRWDRTLVSIRARVAANFDRQDLTARARTRFEGKRILFVLPIMHAGGGGNVVITEARAMMRMGVSVTLLNLIPHKRGFDKSYPDLDVPVLYVNSAADIPALAVNYDAVIATANHSVQWIAPLQAVAKGPVLGYYIQDFEPYFFSEGTSGYQVALLSYTLVPSMRLFTKTEWNRDEVLTKTGRSAAIVGASVDVDLFLPRRRTQRDGSDALHLVAMVRPSSPRRNPEGTIAVLSKLKVAFGDRISVSIFGAEKDGPPIPCGAGVAMFTNYGQLTVEETAHLLSSADIFIDISHFQAMGLTAMEAMACGAIPVVPRAGGSASFAQHGVNALVVDTSCVEEVFEAVAALLDDGERRRAMQGAALAAVARFFPEQPASAILETLFH